MLMRWRVVEVGALEEDQCGVALELELQDVRVSVNSLPQCSPGNADPDELDGGCKINYFVRSSQKKKCRQCIRSSRHWTMGARATSYLGAFL